MAHPAARQAGIETFTIYEKADGVGGTWRDNTYPGRGVRRPVAPLLALVRAQPDWTRTFPEQPEILAYLERCADRFGLRPHLRFGTEVAGPTSTSDAAAGPSSSATERPSRPTCSCSATGQLNRPASPRPRPASTTFEGTSFHSARWDHDHDLDRRATSP